MPVLTNKFRKCRLRMKLLQIFSAKIKTSKVRSKHKTCPHEKIKNRKKGTWTQRKVKIGLRNVYSVVTGV